MFSLLLLSPLFLFSACKDDPKTEPEIDPLDVDDDGDGFSENKGDCDDADPNSTIRREDEDCDGTPKTYDCDDNDPESNTTENDADCDGVVTEEDCDDTNPNTIYDMDCDGTETQNDCDDNDPNLGAQAIDKDCDGTRNTDDCDDNDPLSHIRAEDADCDGIFTAYDCDDHDPRSTTMAIDRDCDGALTAQDCNDSDPTVGAFADDADCDGLVAALDCQDDDPASTMEITIDFDCDGIADVDVVSAGDGFSCAVDESLAVQCWGDNTNAIIPPPSGEFTQVVARYQHACALDLSGTPFCWGTDSGGEVSNIPNRFFVKLGAGTEKSCGEEANGDVYCWGNTDLTGWHNTSQLEGFSMGRYRTCVFRQSTSRVLNCHGGYPSGTPNIAQDDVANKFTEKLSLGYSFDCAINTLTASSHCWGPQADLNAYAPPEGTDLKAIYVGDTYSCGIGYDGLTTCWGEEEYGEMTAPNEYFVHLSLNYDHACGVTKSGDVLCWGRDDSGQATVPTGLKAYGFGL